MPTDSCLSPVQLLHRTKHGYRALTSIMCLAVISSLAIAVATTTLVYGQFTIPAQGYNIGAPVYGVFIFVPLTVTQCEPVLVYYHFSDDILLMQFTTPDNIQNFLNISFPPGAYDAFAPPGYLVWNCNIPAGDSFILNGVQSYTVQPGSSSDCLGNLYTTYPLASYDTSAFESYTTATYSSLATQSAYQLCARLAVHLLSIS